MWADMRKEMQKYYLFLYCPNFKDLLLILGVSLGPGTCPSFLIRLLGTSIVGWWGIPF
jgi:hypothetical protein